MTPNELITAKETARRLHIAVSTLKRWRRCHAGPPWCRVGSRVIRYPANLLEAWIDSNNSEITPDKESAPEHHHRSDDLTGIIQTTAATPDPHPGRWQFLANIRPQGG